MMKSNILIISDVPICSDYTAGQVLSKFCESCAGEMEFFNFWFNQSMLQDSDNDPKSEVILQGKLDVVPFHSGRQLKFLRPISAVLNFLKSFFYIILATAKIAKIIKNRRISCVHLTIQGSRMILLGLLVRPFVKTLIVQQWDPLSWWHNNRQRSLYYHYISKFTLTLLYKCADALVVPSFNWQKKLQKKYQKVFRLDNTFASNIDHKLIYVERECPAFAFVGQIYAEKEFTKLVQMLVAAHGRITLHSFGNATIPEIENVSIISHGFLRSDQIIQEIQYLDGALLPYPVDANFTETSELSFPSKAKLYISAGIPIVSYCEASSGIHIFLTKFYQPGYVNLKYGGRFKRYSFKELDQLRRRAEKISSRLFSAKSEYSPLVNFYREKKNPNV